jgi:nucleotide-binding universal stress UspA family protein
MADECASRTSTILVPLDLTPAGEVKIPVAEEYARALEADVLLLHVLRPNTLDPASVSPAEAMARTYLDTFGARLRSVGIHTEAVIRAGAAAPTIIQEALSRDVKLIVLGTNTRPILSTAVLGSVADQVARAAPCPVLLVRPHGDSLEHLQLRCFHEDAERAGVLVRRELGIRTVEIARIVGSVDRCRELGADFRPPARRRRRHDEERLIRVRHAMVGEQRMPVIELYKLGFGYYVLDGHHRVAVSLELGQLEIEAHVIEYVSETDEQAPGRFAARRAFEQTTGLTEVGANDPDSYTLLLDDIERFRRQQELAELQIAARRWFSDVFRPLWQAIRTSQLSAVLPGYRSADLIARVAAWRAAQAPGVDWLDALDRYVEAHTESDSDSSSSRNG